MIRQLKSAKELVQSSDWSENKKLLINNAIDRAIDNVVKVNTDGDFIKSLIDKSICIDKIILSTDDVKIFTVVNDSEWNAKWPYRFVYFSKYDNEWVSGHEQYANLEDAFLAFLEQKHLQTFNSSFVVFAKRMLRIKD